MEKRGSRVGEQMLHNFIILTISLLLGFILMDPFQMGPAGGPGFRPVKHDIAPYRHVMKVFPRDNASRLSVGRMEFVGQVFGPESIEFDPSGRGPYSGLADGRIVRWMGSDIGWETYAVVVPDWSKEVCEKGEKSTTSKQWKVEPRCGRPLGLRFNRMSGDLYIADAYHGLLVVGPEGGVATPLVTHVKGKPLIFTNDLDVHKNGSVFFTDTSRRYNRVKHFLIMLEGEATGRLLRYDPPTNTTHVVLEGLAFPNGVQISSDQTFLLYTETTNCRVMKYWLEGRKRGNIEVFADLPGFPDNIRMNEKGQFWVAVDCCRTRAQEVLTHNPWLRRLYFRLPAPMSILARIMGMRMHTLISLISPDGEVVDTLEDRAGSVMKLVSEVRERDNKLWVGTVAHNHISTLSHPSSPF